MKTTILFLFIFSIYCFHSYNNNDDDYPPSDDIILQKTYELDDEIIPETEQKGFGFVEMNQGKKKYPGFGTFREGIEGKVILDRETYELDDDDIYPSDDIYNYDDEIIPETEQKGFGFVEMNQEKKKYPGFGTFREGKVILDRETYEHDDDDIYPSDDIYNYDDEIIPETEQKGFGFVEMNQEKKKYPGFGTFREGMEGFEGKVILDRETYEHDDDDWFPEPKDKGFGFIERNQGGKIGEGFERFEGKEMLDRETYELDEDMYPSDDNYNYDDEIMPETEQKGFGFIEMNQGEKKYTGFGTFREGLEEKNRDISQEELLWDDDYIYESDDSDIYPY